MFTNIIGNAVDAMKGPSSGSRKYAGRIRIETRDVAEKGGRWVEISIANNGPKIPDDAIPHLFEPFYTRDKKGGTGLGLAICKKIVEAHGGTIGMKSVKERTEFVVTLPAGVKGDVIDEGALIRHSNEIAVLMPVEPKDRSLSEDIGIFLDLHKKRGGESYLLIVDDEPLFRETIRSLANRIPEVRDNLKIIEADSPDFALKQFEACRFDYVISDIDMGKWKMDGYEFCQAVLDKYADSLVMIHSNKRIHDKDKGLVERANFQGFLPKPMDEGELMHFLAGKRFEQRKESSYQLSAISSQQTQRSSKHVLVVNDEDFMRVALKFSLGKMGDVRVLEADGMVEALQILKDQDVDIVLADINLDGDGSGYDILKAVRAGGRATKFYMMSGMPREDEWPKARELGADGYIEVPYEDEELKGIL